MAATKKELTFGMIDNLSEKEKDRLMNLISDPKNPKLDLDELLKSKKAENKKLRTESKG